MPKIKNREPGAPRRLTKTEVAILGYVGAHEGETCSKAKIAKALGRNVKTIDILISNLRKDGLIVVEPRWAESGGQLANAYRLARMPTQE
ncbi:helix-turn-helix domain-containing protein [Olsenella sp. An293]|uniref:helix-turn-helix domain-containing protein n=1 Tax=Olsenella sp. An293 TaxID=1965626 RepID=UPI000B38B3F1|nr:helix-turn-helix domain-containing protein [Olsenella sp. An293]OUO33543.1 hypothetical protein B5F85_01370 [Olsenella sp. An293]